MIITSAGAVRILRLATQLGQQRALKRRHPELNLISTIVPSSGLLQAAASLLRALPQANHHHASARIVKPTLKHEVVG